MSKAWASIKRLIKITCFHLFIFSSSLKYVRNIITRAFISSEASEVEQESMSANGSVPTETSRLVDGRIGQDRSQGTKPSSIIKWVLCAGAGWTLIGTFAVLIGSKFFSGSRWSANTYVVNNLPYFHDFDPGNGTGMNSSVSVAFIGNGMQYVNDLPRFMETLSEGNITQNSCFRTGTSLNTITIHGNGMSPYWNTSVAHINGTNVYDFGACTVKQLLFGRDDHLQELVSKGHFKHDPLIGNPCLDYPEYTDYLNNYYAQNKKPKWDFVVLNDNSQDAMVRKNWRHSGIYRYPRLSSYPQDRYSDVYIHHL
jgi:hypothetical protein